MAHCIFLNKYLENILFVKEKNLKTQLMKNKNILGKLLKVIVLLWPMEVTLAQQRQQKKILIAVKTDFLC